MTIRHQVIPHSAPPPAALVAAFPLALLLLATGCTPEAPAGSYDADGNLVAEQVVTRTDFNVVLISIDTLRADHLGCYGYERDTSPNIDRLAGESILFERVNSCAPWTTPSYISLMTSLYPSVHKVYRYPNPGSLDAKAVTLAEILRGQGFATGGFTEGGYAQGKIGLDHGFTTFPGWPEDRGTYISHEFAPSRLQENMRRAFRWLAQNRDEKFFLFFHTYEPHYPYRPPAEYLRRIRTDWSEQDESRRLQAVLAKLNEEREPASEDRGLVYRHHLQGDLGTLPPADVRKLRAILKGFSLSEWTQSAGFQEDLDYVIDLYDAEILYADEAVGRLVDKLRSLNVFDRTLIVVTSDHGEGLMDHGRVDHGFNLYQELLHVPLILRLPGGQAAGSSVSVPCRLIDVMPTVLDALGLPAPHEAQGRSLLTLLEEGSRDEPERDSLGEGLTLRDRELVLGSMRWGRWKYIRREDNGREEIYDLVADPGEKDDLSGRQSSVLDKMRDRLQAARAANLEAGETLVPSATMLSDAERRRLDSLGYLGQGAGTRKGRTRAEGGGASLGQVARASLVRALKGASAGTPVWFAVSELNPGAQALLEELQQAFTEGGWQVENVHVVPFSIRPGVLVLAADPTPPGYVLTARDALAAAGLGSRLMTDYRAHFEEKIRTQPGYKGFELAPGQTYVVVVGRIK